MKKIIQISAFLTLTLVFSVVFVKAQTVNQYSANIPFDFNIGQKSYPAGDYRIKVVAISPDAVTFSLADRERNNLQTIIIPKKGDGAPTAPQLVFSRYRNQRFLSRLTTREMRLSMTKTDAERRAADRNTEVIHVQGKNKNS